MKKHRLVAAVFFAALLLLATLQTGHAGFWSWARLTDATDASPALHIVSSNAVYVAIKGTDNGIYLDKWGGAAWSGWGPFPQEAPRARRP
jgi:hypothetical protein